MANYLKTLLTLLLLTTGCAGRASHTEPEKEEPMSLYDPDDAFEDVIIHEDPFDLRARGDVRAPAQQVTYPIEPREGPWTANNQLGTSHPFSPDDNNRQTILKLDEWGMPESWSVALGIDWDDEEAEAIGAQFSVTAECDVGAGGSVQKVEVDWRNGAVFSMPMNALNVIARYEPAIVGIPLIVPESLRLTVTIGKTFSGGSAAKTLMPPQLAAGATTSTFRIPAFATHVMVVGDQNAYDAANRLFFRGAMGGPTLTNVRGSFLPDFAPDGVPIPFGARYIDFFNGSAAAIDFAFVFPLSL